LIYNNYLKPVSGGETVRITLYSNKFPKRPNTYIIYNYIWLYIDM